MATDHEVVPGAPEPIDEGEQPEGLLEHLEVRFLHGSLLFSTTASLDFELT